MSKILRRCLSLVLVVMLLASLTISGSLTASADNKTGDGLASYAMNAYYEGWKYVWGGASYGAVDCSGLIYSYVGGGARVTEDMLYSSPESGYVSDGVPDIPGLGLWQPGHVGVYVGGGMAVDARDEISNVCYQSVSTKSWVMWFKVSGVSYGNDSSVTNDNQSTVDTESSNAAADSEAEAEETDSVLSQGSRGAEVKELQQRLKELGYFEDNTTEYFGSVTQSALIDFQTAAGIDADGVYSESVKAALFSDSAPVKITVKEDSEEVEAKEELVSESDSDEEADDIALTTESESQKEESDSEVVSYSEETQQDSENGIFAEFDEYQTAETDSGEIEASDESEIPSDALYSLGDDSNEISDVQYILIKLGYFDYAITGHYCENTAEAVARFRLDNDMDIADYIDEETLSLIYSKYSDSDVSESESTDSVSDDENLESEIFPDESEEAIYDPDTLRLGMSGSKVENLQRSLVVWGYLSDSDISETGLFDETTESAVINAQKAMNMEASGVVTKEFERALDSGNSSLNVTEVKSADESSDVNSDAQDSNSDSGSSDSETALETVSSDSSSNTVGSTASGSTSQAVGTDSSSQSVAFVQTGIEDYFSKTLVLIFIAVSLVVIFFAGTVHYWNVSMEKRRQRARKATTVSSYRRRSM